MAFVSGVGVSRSVKVETSARRSAVVVAAKSKSMPFLENPASCDGTYGAADVGFDPLYLTDVMDPKWLQESEIKHGRIAMLATLGFIVQEFVHLPGKVFETTLATDAVKVVPTGGLWQIFLFCGAAEVVMNKGQLGYDNMFEDPERKPGVFGFDPLGLGKKPEMFKKYQANEIVNGRLAMIAIGGFIHQNWIYKQPIVYQLTHFKPMSM